MNQNQSVTLLPAHIFVSRKPVIICSVVGTAVAVTMWDRELRFGGMNHFLFPRSVRNATTTAQFGNGAVTELVRIMLANGAKKSRIEAQIFGGAVPDWNTSQTLGNENIEAARKALHRQRISIVSEDVGGSLGRKIAFDTNTGIVATMKVRTLRRSDFEFEL